MRFSTSETPGLSLNQRCLPRRALQGETLRERVDLIVVTPSHSEKRQMPSVHVGRYQSPDRARNFRR
jgi:hypothetical protein